MRPEAIPVVKSSLEMKRKTLKFNARQYRQRLAVFERAHRMTTKQFAKKFSAGELGDDAKWFEWEFANDALREIERQVKLLDSVRL
jgi:putative PIN family toxin of toxin-antitoxin system